MSAQITGSATATGLSLTVASVEKQEGDVPVSLEWEQCSWERGDQAGRNYLQVMPLLGQHKGVYFSELLLQWSEISQQ